tara:strand:+ start:4413 stop:5849 length:1437 start_codon:yes stop_codon:yes gene_type:complete
MILMKNFPIPKGLILLAIVLLVACSEDDPKPPVIEDPAPNAVAGFKATIPEDGITFWPTTARLTNDTTSDLDISTQSVVTDDEMFLTLTTSGEVQLRWHPSYRINWEAQTDAEVVSDDLELSRSWLLEETETGFLYEDATYQLEATVLSDTSLDVLLRKKEGGAELSWLLEPKSASSYSNPPSSIGTAEQILYLDAHNPEVAIAYARSNNNVYIYRQAGPMEEAISRFNLSTSTFTDIVMPDQNSASKAIEFMDGFVFGIGAENVYQFDYDLSGPLETYDALPLSFGYGSTSVNGKIYSIGGFGSLGESPIADFSLEDPIFTPIIEMPKQKQYPDGVVYQDQMYVFGGLAYVNGEWEITNTIDVYSLPGFELTDIPMDIIGFRYAAAALDGHLIYVAGREIVEIIDNGSGNTTISTEDHVGVFNALTGAYTSYDVADLFPADERIFGMTLGDGNLYIATGGPSESSSLFGIRIYKIEL